MNRITVLFSLLSLLFAVCDDNSTNSVPECTPISDPSKKIEIVYPTNNSQLTAGELVNIQFKKDGPTKLDLEFSLDNGLTFRNIFEKSMANYNDGVTCMDTIWEVGKSLNTQLIDKDTTIVFKISNYNDGDIYDQVIFQVKK